MTFHWWYVLIGVGVVLIALVVFIGRFLGNPKNYL
jgi:hypothetical protein